MASHFPKTHYDGLKSREPWLFEYVEKDLQHIAECGLKGPFGSTDDFSDHFESYLERKLGMVKDGLRYPYFEATGTWPTEQELHAALKSLPEYPSILYTAHSDYLSAVNFELFGRKTFYIADSLVERLAVTELDAPAEYLRLPFPCCMLVLTSSVAKDALYRIGDLTPPDDRDSIAVYLMELEYQGLRKILMAIYHGGYRRVHNYVKREVLVHPDWHIESVLRTDWNKLYELNPEWVNADAPTIGEIIGDTEDERIFYQGGLPFFRIVINSLLYLASNEPDLIHQLSPCREIEARLSATSSRSKRKKLKNEARRHSALDGAMVGTQLGAIVVEKPSQRAASEDGNGTPAGRRFLVRGHWRNQACGPGLKDRKLIFIEPYYKGPDLGELVNRPYVVQ